MIDPVEWRALRRLFGSAFGSSLHVSVSTVDAGGAPVVTPIGSFFLAEPGRAFYFELYARRLGERLDADPRVSVLAVDSGKLLWLRALFTGRFARRPAVRLVGRAEPGSREATETERARFVRRVGPAWRLRGSQRLWGGLVRVREIRIDRVERIGLGPMST